MVVFLASYFPMKTQTNYISTREKDAIFNLDPDCQIEKDSEINLNETSKNVTFSQKCFVKTMFDRMVFLVIDALRADILDKNNNHNNINSNNQNNNYHDKNSYNTNNLGNMMREKMTYLTYLIRSRSSMVYRSIVRPPTVTLSGIKVYLIINLLKINH